MTSPRHLRSAIYPVDRDRRDRFGVLRVFGRDLSSCPRAQRDRWVSRALTYWRQRGFPFPTVTNGVLEAEFRRLVVAEPNQILKGTRLLPSMVGLRVANSFHPQIWRVKVHGVSALERFNDDLVLRRVLEKALVF